MELIKQHLDQLELSGITPKPHLGLESNSQGLGFRYWDVEKRKFDPDFVRTRLDEPRGGQKYTQPKGSRVRVYFPPTYAASAHDAMRERWYNALLDKDDKPRSVVIVEGEKKALALQERLGTRVIVLGLGGVWNWGVKSDDGDRVLVQDFKSVKNWKDRQVYICFDSDVNDNPQVERAEFMLQQQLKTQFGVWARLMTLEPSEDGEKVGIDDLIYEFGDAFPVLWKELKENSVTGVRYRIPEPISGRELVETDWPFENVIVGKGPTHLLVEGGCSFVHAGSGVGKTYFLLQLVACLATGDNFIGFGCQKKRVLFLQQELSNGWFARRVRRLRKVFGPDVDSINYISGDFNLASVDRFKTAKMHLTRLERLIVRQEAQVVVLDPLQGFYDLSEGSVDHSREFMKAVVRVAKKTGAHIVMSHHDRKDQSGPSMTQMRGGSPFSDLSDTVIGVKRLPQYERSDSGRLVQKKDDFGEVIFHPTDLVLNFDKVRHNEGPLPPRTVITRMPKFDNREWNPFFTLKDDPQGEFEYEDGGEDAPF